MNGRQFIARVRKWARERDQEVRFVASEDLVRMQRSMSGTAEQPSRTGRRRSAGLLNKMLADLRIDRDVFLEAAEMAPTTQEDQPHV